MDKMTEIFEGRFRTEEKPKSPAALMADLLLVMMERATEAERQRDEARKCADDWHTYYVRKADQLEECEAKLKECEAKLAAEIAEHQSTRNALRGMIERMEKGASENGESNRAGEDDLSRR